MLHNISFPTIDADPQSIEPDRAADGCIAG